MMQRQTTKQLALFEAQIEARSQEADTYNQYTMMNQANTFAQILARRQLPMFYFYEAAKHIKVERKTCRIWRINSWPLMTRPGDDNLMQKVSIYLSVYMRLKKFPDDETYDQAMENFKERVKELEQKRFSKNLIAQQVKMSSRTLKEITSNGRGENKRHNHCPWEMLKMLETMEGDILQEKEQQREMKKNRIIRDGINYKEPELEDEAPYNPNLIWEGDGCARCGTGWHCLVPDGKDAWGRTVVVCRICSTDNIVEQIELDPDDPDQRPPKVREFIEPYWNCWQCNARFHNLKRERVDRWGNTVYICVRCAHTNRIRRELQNRQTTKPAHTPR